jgi:hypothetical protein
MSRAPLHRVIREHPVLASIGALAIVLCTAFVLRLGMLLWTGGPAAWADRPVEDWMTPGFLIRAYEIDPAALADLFGVDPASLRGRPLRDIAREIGLPLPDLLRAIEAMRAA